MNAPSPHHQPVLVDAVMRHLAPERGGRFVDGTVGCGGHARMVLAAAPENQLLGLDADQEALDEAARVLAPFAERFRLVRTNYTAMRDIAIELGWQSVDGILLDVGISSLQVDRPQRGFSYQHDGPLDMRMDAGQELTAARVLNRCDVDELTGIFKLYGELPGARKLAHAVVARRERNPWAWTGEFAELVRTTLPQPRGRRSPIEARAFQALRIAVNNELESLDVALEEAIELLAPGGRLVVISFHSLEDRLVKRTFRDAAASCVCPPDFPVCRCDKVATLKPLTRKPIQADEDEIRRNRRAACARLRAAERLPAA